MRMKHMKGQLLAICPLDSFNLSSSEVTDGCILLSIVRKNISCQEAT